ncbi:DnaJ family domain-containing protein [Nocardiopsis oceani]
MTERKPPGTGFESWIDTQIRQARERGEFDDLPGEGKPIADIDRPYDENWWIKRKLKSESVSLLPPTLRLRKEAEDTLEEASGARTEKRVRELLEGLNKKIREMNSSPAPGPPLNLMPYDIDAFLEKKWRGPAES